MCLRLFGIESIQNVLMKINRVKPHVKRSTASVLGYVGIGGSGAKGDSEGLVSEDGNMATVRTNLTQTIH